MSPWRVRNVSSASVSSRSAEISNWLTRPQVVALVGLTEREIEAMHGRELHPQRAPDRSWRYPPKEVSAIAVGASADGVVSAKVFALFKKNTPLPDVVIETQQTPARVTALRAEYSAMIGGLLVSPATVEALRALIAANDISSEEKLLAATRAHLEARFVAGFREGQEDVQDVGEIVDQKTGERRRIPRAPRT